MSGATDEAHPGDGGRRSSGIDRGFLIALIAVVALNTAFRLPSEYNFNIFGMGDPGGCLSVYGQAARGSLPYRDFGYLYGLAPIPIGLAWFAVVGRSPATFLLWVGLWNVLFCWAIARLAKGLEVGLPGKLWLLVTLPITVVPNALSLSHAMEIVLLAGSVAAVAVGRRPIALAMATACLFVKPGMAYFLGLPLVLMTVWESVMRPPSAEPPGGSWRLRLARSLAPAVVVGVVLLVALSAWIGPRAVVESVVPGRAMEIYRRTGYGSSRMLRELLAPKVGNLLNYYLGTSTATLAAASVALVLGAGFALSKVFDPRKIGSLESRRYETLILCAYLNVIYFSLMLNPMTTQYFFLIAFGVAALGTLHRLAGPALLAFCLVGLVGQYSYVRRTMNDRSAAIREPSLGSLYCERHLAEEWRHARDLTRAGPTALLLRCHGDADLFPGLTLPTSWYFDPGLPTDRDVRAEVEILERSRYVILGTSALGDKLLRFFPEFRAALDSKRRIWAGDHFAVYEAVGTK